MKNNALIPISQAKTLARQGQMVRYRVKEEREDVKSRLLSQFSRIFVYRWALQDMGSDFLIYLSSPQDILQFKMIMERNYPGCFPTVKNRISGSTRSSNVSR